MASTAGPYFDLNRTFANISHRENLLVKDKFNQNDKS